MIKLCKRVIRFIAIKHFEKKQARSLREIMTAILKEQPVPEAAKQKLLDLDIKINRLRAKK